MIRRVPVGLAIVGMGCGARTASDEGPVLDRGAACETLASAACDRRTVCGSPAGVGQRFVDDEQCRERWTIACRLWVDAPDARIRAEDVAACARTVADASCGHVGSLADPTVGTLPWCLEVPGVRLDGASCSVDSECRSSFCRFTAAAAGACASRSVTVAYEGDRCDDATVRCASSLSCRQGRCGASECGPGGCFVYGAHCGGIDDPGRVCPPGTECKSQSDRGAGQCVEYARESQACTEYAGPPCLFPARCVDGTCSL